MKKLQSNFTTPEQSKRLLELGVPADSADCFYRKNPPFKGKESRYEQKPTILFYDEVYSEWSKCCKLGSLPCWSVGRLIEIYKIVGEEAGQCISCSKNQTQVESLVQLYEENVGLLDFSKLEE